MTIKTKNQLRREKEQREIIGRIERLEREMESMRNVQVLPVAAEQIDAKINSVISELFKASGLGGDV